jgi:hypothetical protein
VWDGSDYIDPDTGVVLPTWREALEADPEARPVHSMRFGNQADMKGIIAPSPDADRAVRYPTKYLTKAIADPLNDDDNDEARERHIDRMAAELQIPAVLAALRELTALRNPTRPAKPWSHPWPLHVESTRPRAPWTRRPPCPGLP